MATAKHPNKHIREVLAIAAERGWRIVKSGGSAHAWGKMYCPGARRGACVVSIYSTPSNPRDHAQYLLARLNDCDCVAQDEAPQA